MIEALEFSVLMSIYNKDDPEFLNEAINSIINQSILPAEIVIVIDGPINDVNFHLIDYYKKAYPKLFNIISQEKNTGLGNSLAIGIKSCKHDLVARMDSDDICVYNRFEKQLKFMAENPQIAVVGSSVEEFKQTPGDLNKFRYLPEKWLELKSYAKYRSPANHPSIMLRKAAVLASGNYNGDILLFEDFSLFARLILKGYKFYNIQEVLLYFRVGNGLQTIKRRSGLHYVKNETKFLLYIYKIGYISLFDLIKSFMIKTPIRMLPSQIVLRLYNIFLRKSNIVHT